ncbi:MAG: mannose-1-phosphate guanylyltransferase/mannose-6-phosphate isomerase [Gammaproteobacteria bacterium]|nr:mannose-1-phosphate guanylyltransferase/mannose-6-phosphate isomerase [Gammaproteobacteria bacterium]
MSSPIIPVILAGGSGTRLWPLSRRTSPKQFTALTGSQTMLQDTVERAEAIEAAGAPIIVTNAAQADTVREQAPGATLIIEPVGRNTAPAAALAALYATADGTDPILLVMPADHVIKDLDAYLDAMARAIPHADAGRLVTFGIVPTAPETGYGYIEQGGSIGDAYRVARFVEKPNAAIAANYIASGRYLWNSGMFVFRASRFLDELGKHRPEMLAAVRSASSHSARSNGTIRIDLESFAAIEGDSIDYAVMEQTADAVVVPLAAGWSDIGSWSALWDIGDRDENDNILTGDVLALDTSRSYIRAESRLVAIVGLDDVVVVETPDAILVCSREKAQDVAQLVERLEAADRPEIE